MFRIKSRQIKNKRLYAKLVSCLLQSIVFSTRKTFRLLQLHLYIDVPVIYIYEKDSKLDYHIKKDSSEKYEFEVSGFLVAVAIALISLKSKTKKCKKKYLRSLRNVSLPYEIFICDDRD